MTAKDGEEIKRAYYRLYDHIRRRPHSPGDMKECLIRFNMALLNVIQDAVGDRVGAGDPALHAGDRRSDELARGA